jgi:S-DNA-T family DNA segregation ATPase FtsK/SpoIIIE
LFAEFYAIINYMRRRRPGRPSRSQGRPEKSARGGKKEIFNLDLETKRGIVVIALFTLAILIALSFGGWAGRFGAGFYKYANFLLGRGMFLIPIVLVVAGFIIIRYIHKNVYLSVALGAVIFILGFLSLVHVLIPEEQGGGYVGYIISWPFLYLLGKWASFIVFLALILISILIAFNIPLRKTAKEKEREEELAYADDLEEIVEAEESFDKGGLGNILKKLLPRPRFKVKPLSKEERETISIPLSHPPISDYKFPPLELLEKDKGSPSSGDIRINAGIIQKTLENFGIEVEMGEVNIGPTVTQYTLRPASGIKLSSITALHRDLSLALAAHPIRIEAPIPGRSLVGIEVPNKAVTLVRLRNLLEGIDLRKDLSRLNLALGRDVAGNPVWADLSRMPHLLIAGATGSGKSICINSTILTLLYQKTPEELKFILVDPKRVELPVYNDIPHLLTPVIVDLNKTVNALKWAIGEMERRYELLAEVKVRNIFSYNSLASKEKKFEILPYIIIVIDELADIMAAFGREVEGAIIRLAQMSRAVGIHLIISTQRPSVEVITGLIKANITSRIAFQVASQVDSRTILDAAGAEKLLGNGDMLFLSGETAHPKRIQGVYASDKEVKNVVKFIKGEKTAEYSEEVVTPSPEKRTLFGGTGFSGDDPLYEDAKELVIQAGKASASYLQRRLQIGYARAARLLDMLEEQGVIGPIDGAKPREVFVKKERDENFDEEPEEDLEQEI